MVGEGGGVGGAVCRSGGGGEGGGRQQQRPWEWCSSAADKFDTATAPEQLVDKRRNQVVMRYVPR